MLLYLTSVPSFMVICCALFFFLNLCHCCFRFKSYNATFLISVNVIFCNVLHASFWMHLFMLLFPLPLLPFYYFLFLLSLCLVPLLLLLVCLTCLSPSLRTTRPDPSSAHMDMSTVAFDVDPLDLEAEEPPESQGDPRSTKGMSGSVTSPQANAHRLPFFKKVTSGAVDNLPTSAGLSTAFVPRSSTGMGSGLISPSPSH